MRKRDIMNYVVAEGGNKVQRDIAEKVVDFMIGIMKILVYNHHQEN